MSIEKILENMKSIYDGFLNYLDNDQNEEENFENLIKIFQDIQIRDDLHDLKLFFHLVVEICNNHHRCPNFFDKIDRILNYFKDDIKKYYPNSEIFDIFKSNKRLLLFLVEEKIMNMDERIVKQIITGEYVTNKYPQYFASEILPFMDEKLLQQANNNSNDLTTKSQPDWVEEIEKGLPAYFYENRKKGENDSCICKLIQKDSIDEFTAYVSQNYIPLDSTIESSIYETNSFLIQKQNEANQNISLIEYAAFFGSIQIFKYLKIKGIKMNQSLWLYSIHGKNTEIIHLLEESHIDLIKNICNNPRITREKSYKGCFNESIKCSHNDIANYILSNHLQSGDENTNDTFIEIIK